MKDPGISANTAKSSGLALQGLALGLLLALCSMISFRFAGFEAALTFVPLIAIFFWPQGASRGLSSAFIFGIGFMVDILSAGPLGLWAMIYLVGYGALRPDLREGEGSLRALWLSFAAWALMAACALFVLGWLFIDGHTAAGALLSQTLISLFVFPFVFAMHQGFQYLSDNPDSPRFSL